MRKQEELSNPKSCLNKATENEALFVLLGRDKTTPQTIEFWAIERMRLGLNQWGDPQIMEALTLAREIRQEQNDRYFADLQKMFQPKDKQ